MLETFPRANDMCDADVVNFEKFFFFRQKNHQTELLESKSYGKILINVQNYLKRPLA